MSVSGGSRVRLSESNRGRGRGRGGGKKSTNSHSSSTQGSPITSRKNYRESSQDRAKALSAATATITALDDEQGCSLLVLIEDEDYPQLNTKILAIPEENIIELRENIQVFNIFYLISLLFTNKIL